VAYNERFHRDLRKQLEDRRARGKEDDFWTGLKGAIESKQISPHEFSIRGLFENFVETRANGQRVGTELVNSFNPSRGGGRTLLEEAGTAAEMLDAVFANRPRSPLDAVTRLQALKEFLLLPEAGILAAINKRIANILKKTTLAPDAAVNTGALTEDAERQLHKVLTELRVPVQDATAQRRYALGLKALVALRAPVDDFFERIMVMDEDAGRRNNRLALLRDVQRLLGGVADLSRLPG